MNTAAIVAIKKVPDYDPDRVLAAMRAGLELLDGMKAFVRPGQRVLLKPNLISGFAPERAATTHPAVVRAAILLVQEAGGQPFVGDSPGMGTLADALRGSGLMPVLEATGTPWVDFSECHEYDAPDNIVARRLTLTKALLSAEVIISLPKLKTHAQMTLTAALKNQFGVVPGTLKSQWHFRLQQPEWLAALILDINRVARPSLAILDAIMAMEGLGPSAGKPRFIGALLASRDLAALDTVACQLIHLDPMRVPLLAVARKQQFGVTIPEEIEVTGDDWRQCVVPDFDRIEHLVDVARLVPLPKPVLNWIRRQWTARPRILADRCTQCGICEQGCPVTPSAIHPKSLVPPQVDDVNCICCYCCHEFCPANAIELRTPWLTRYLPLNALADRCGRALGYLMSHTWRK